MSERDEQTAPTPPTTQTPATAANLLVVSDFDGTLAGYSTQIYDVPVHPDAISALNRLATMPHTNVAVLSGRELATLSTLCPTSEKVMLVGSHGAESSTQAVSLTPEQQQTYAEMRDDLETVVAKHEGAFVEKKPVNLVTHVLGTQQRDPAEAEDIMERSRALWARKYADREVTMTNGKGIVEFSILDITKGTWIERAKADFGASCVVFLGDDVTDENGFRVLGDGDFGIKVGDGETLARHRVADIDAVADYLTALANARATFLSE